jgi:anti-sigma B factor antagonist
MCALSAPFSVRAFDVVDDADGVATDVRVEVEGELDIATADELERAVWPVIARRPDRIVVDFAGLTFCDSSGTRVMISLYREAQRTGTQFVIVAARHEVRRIFEIVQLGQLLDIADE